MFRRSVAALAAASGILAAGPASSAALLIEASGTLDAYFGVIAPETLVLNVPFTLQMTFGLDDTLITTELGTEVARGGPFHGFPTTAVWTLTIEGFDYDLAGHYASFALQNAEVLQQSAFPAPGVEGIIIGANFGSDTLPTPIVLPVDLTQPPAGNLCAIGQCYGGQFAAGPWTGNLTNVTSYFVTYDPDFVVTPPGGIPEPATWAVMILGFGAAGAMLRRRKVAAYPA